VVCRVRIRVRVSFSVLEWYNFTNLVVIFCSFLLRAVWVGWVIQVTGAAVYALPVLP